MIFAKVMRKSKMKYVSHITVRYVNLSFTQTEKEGLFSVTFFREYFD